MTAIDLIANKKGVLVDHPWMVGDTKEKKFREVQKAVTTELRSSLSCNCDTAKMPMARQLVRRSGLIHAFSMNGISGTT